MFVLRCSWLIWLQFMDTMETTLSDQFSALNSVNGSCKSIWKICRHNPVIIIKLIIAYVLLLTFVTSHSLFNLFVLHLFISSFMIPLLLSFLYSHFWLFSNQLTPVYLSKLFCLLLPSYCVYV